MAGLQDARQAGGEQLGERVGADNESHWIGNYLLSPSIRCPLGEGRPACPLPVVIFEGGGGLHHQPYDILAAPPDIKQ